MLQRRNLFEITDQNWCPKLLRDTTTAVLRFTSVMTNMYEPVIPLLRAALEELDCHDIVDLCSGGTGPMLLIQELLDSREGYEVKVILTDKFPNLAAFQAAAAASPDHVAYWDDPVDATAVPDDLHGFRTLFASFHHFQPEKARKILEDTARRGEGIGIFEFTGRNPGIFLIMLLSPLYLLLATPFIKPFSWRRLFWTYVIPLIPLGVLWEGMVSNMRTYSPDELWELVRGMGSDGYTWKIGRLRGTWTIRKVRGKGLHMITYLIGYPRGGDAA